MVNMSMSFQPTRLPSNRCIVLFWRLWRVMRSLRRACSGSIWPGKCRRNYLALRAAVRERSKITVSAIRHSACTWLQQWPPDPEGWVCGEVSNSLSRCVMDLFPSCHLAKDTLDDLLISIFVAVATVMAAGLLDRLWD